MIVSSKWGRFGLYSYYIDGPEPAIVDTGIASSVDDIAAALGDRLAGVRWILLTHGHIDHVGGAYALWELTGRRAQVVIHEADAELLRSRRAHVQEYVEGRGRYLDDPDGEARLSALTEIAISGELEPTVLVRGGETLGCGVRVHAIPGHRAGSVGYELDGDVFVGDSVELHGAASGFPGYDDPDAYRASLEYLRDEVRPNRMFLGHEYRHGDGTSDGVELDREQARVALEESLTIEARIRDAVSDGAWQDVAKRLSYTGDPTLEPSPFFTTLHGYRSR